MIGKLKKGSSFAGCIRYVTGKDEAKILASDGVLLGTNAEMTQSFELQRQLNPRIKKPVGHIALSFKPEEIVRHHNTDNPHCHIVYNRINNEGKLISDAHDYRRNEQVTKALKSKYGLTYGTDKSKTNTRKLRNAERAKYEIHNAVKDALKVADSWQKFKKELAKRGVMRERRTFYQQEPALLSNMSRAVARMSRCHPYRRAARTLGTVFLPLDFLLQPMLRPLSHS
ncbi:relaxase/mobilization nuclease domain-containing protein, partial [Segatella copri]|uniref:relaxase/mobilization nuclease domain-containing protein n=1 Tax=Segatella copri TaxID=165179 RepID=UPI0022E954DC